MTGSTISPCHVCGAEIWLRVLLISVNRRRGVTQWLERRDGVKCPCLESFSCVKMKADKNKPTPLEEMRDRWNAQQATGLVGCNAE